MKHSFFPASAAVSLALVFTARALAQPAPEPPPPVDDPIPLPQPEAAAPAAGAPVEELPLEEPPPPASLAEVDERLRRTEEMLMGSRRGPTWGGYLDVGFFAVQAGGVGYRQDFGHAQHPELASRYGWVFDGDIFATAVNTRGEPADMGDAPGVDRLDSVNSRGAPGFILNEANFTLDSALSPNAIVTASVNLAPRTGREFRFGDLFDVDLAQLEWLPTASQRTSIFVGKIESVLGIEYRERKSNRRFGVTPTLLARYTTGTALGLKVRSKFGGSDQVVIAAAVTNGSNTTEPFHFYDETDSNAGKTASGRLSYLLPLPGEIELGASGSYGSQDRGLVSDKAMWFFGFDMIARIRALEVKAQWLRGRAPGDEVDGVYGLDLKQGGYLEVDYMITPSLGALARAEFRDAFVWLGSERAYITKSWRGVLGARWVFSDKAAVKAEYLRNGEYGGTIRFPNDVFTSSLVMSF